VSVRVGECLGTRAERDAARPPISAVPPPTLSGAFGFVVLAEEVATKERWAIKFLERGNKITKVGK
jgi:hypothetical protein